MHRSHQSARASTSPRCRDNRNAVPLSPLLRAYDQVILDLDGCVWVGGLATSRAAEAIAASCAGRACGWRFSPTTRRRSPEEYVRKLWSIGCQRLARGGRDRRRRDPVRSSPRRPPADGAFVIGSRRCLPPRCRRRVTGSSTRPRAPSRPTWSSSSATTTSTTTSCAPPTVPSLSGARILGGGPRRELPGRGWPEPGHRRAPRRTRVRDRRTARTVGKPDPQIFRTALERLGDGRTLVDRRPARRRSRRRSRRRPRRRDRAERRHDPRAGRARARSGARSRSRRTSATLVLGAR